MDALFNRLLSVIKDDKSDEGTVQTVLVNETVVGQDVVNEEGNYEEEEGAVRAEESETESWEQLSEKDAGIKEQSVEQGVEQGVKQPEMPYVDECPIERLPCLGVSPTSSPAQTSGQSGYVPSLFHSPSQPDPALPIPSSSPSLFDKSMGFIKREFDNLKFTLSSRPLLTHQQWFELFNSDGQLLNTKQFNHYLLNYDWPTELQQEGWKYLFDFYDIHSNHLERVLVEKRKRLELRDLLESWTKLLEDDNGDEAIKARVNKLIYLINKDVPRTDRSHPFFKSIPENSEILKDLLVTFCYSNPDIGYVQGMNEVLSLFLITIEDKAVAYWTYSNYLLKNKLFFNSMGLMAKLNGIAELLNIHDSELYIKLKSLDCSNMLFCQRWILLGFKRECKTFEMAVKIFTMINSLKPSHYIQLEGLGKCELLSLDMFLVVAILVDSRSTLMGFTDMTDVYQWTGRFKITGMSTTLHAKQMYEEWAKNDYE